MARKGSEDMYVRKTPEPVEGLNKTMRSRLRASEKYDRENVDNIRLRVPKGWKEQIKAYVDSSDEYTSINGMICDLIKNKVGIKED